MDVSCFYLMFISVFLVVSLRDFRSEDCVKNVSGPKEYAPKHSWLKIAKDD